MIIVYQKWLRRTKISGMALFPFILLCKSSDKRNLSLINHEKIHLRQQLEMGILLFYIWYCIEFLFLWLRYQNQHTAYQNISFEREAYANEHNLNYLKNRRFWAFLKY